MVNAGDHVDVSLPDLLVGCDSKNASGVRSGDDGCALCHVLRSESVMRQGARQQNSKASSQTSKAAHMIKGDRYSFKVRRQKLALFSSVSCDITSDGNA